MTGQDLFSVLTIIIFIVCTVLSIKRKIILFDDNYSYNVITTILFILSLLSTIFITVFWFIDNWQTKIL